MPKVRAQPMHGQLIDNEKSSKTGTFFLNDVLKCFNILIDDRMIEFVK